mmetsp:Transcript_29945/g.78528  ORF Transcript_29945/g.78528 Transcript_29945/m.78528 type:complete len:1114 (+) Transcript_29945:74-3415(+)
MAFTRKSSIMRDAKGKARQTLITRGPGSLRVNRRPPEKKSWTKHGSHMFGVADSVMLENFESEEKFLGNLRVRFDNDLIYTYIRGVCISVNPYQDLGIYTSSLIDEYYGTQVFELPPHLYAIANEAYYQMKEETSDQCILISGESGAGKTEAAKQILQFLAACATDTGRSKMIRDRLLQSNPILEAFGNAKTARNDNSSRFGKYMEIEFDFKGEPVGGRILNYLLEKSRVIYQLDKERNYHIFYMAIAGGSPDFKAACGLDKSPDEFNYLKQGGLSTVAELDDAGEWASMFEAMAGVGVGDVERDALLEVVAFIVLLGEIEFEGGEKAAVANGDVLSKIAGLFNVDAAALGSAMTMNTIIANGEEVKSILDANQAAYARDALAKAIYDRAFSWLVNRLNKALEECGKDAQNSRSTVMGLLDIYGFEILATNGFEQVCINYCNEKLQQVFIELTLKREQEEYKREGIEWVPVEYFNNALICDFIESKAEPHGMITLLDDCCLGPGDMTDTDFLAVLDKAHGGHDRYSSFANDKSIARDVFVVKHYAGDVTYNIAGFIDKNNDLLYRDLKAVMLTSSNSVITSIFSKEELESKKRPPTAGTQFRGSMQNLMNTLMAKQPSYVRCIKPNGEKKPSKWDQDLVAHQVKYLGLMENLRVARAGYCYRRPFAHFLQRFKSLCPDTWPNWKGNDKDGVQRLTDHLKLPAGECKIGRTKVFIRNPATVTTIEKMFQARKPALATSIAACYKGYRQRKKYQALKRAATVAQKHARSLLARLEAAQRKKGVVAIRGLIEGFIHRKEPMGPKNEVFLRLSMSRYFERVRDNLPTKVTDYRWISDKYVPPYLEDTTDLLRKMCYQVLSRKYRLALTPEKKAALKLKLEASELFNGRKQSYPHSVAVPFTTNRIDDLAQFELSKAAYLKVKTDEEIDSPLYATIMHKIDRSSYKHKRDDMILLTNTTIHVFASKKGKLKLSLPLRELKGISVSRAYDGICVLHTTGEVKGDKGDMIFDTPHVIEFVTMLMRVLGGLRRKFPDFPNVELGVENEIQHERAGGKTGTICFETAVAEKSPYSTVKKEGKPCLLVTVPEMANASDFKRHVSASVRMRTEALSGGASEDEL